MQQELNRVFHQPIQDFMGRPGKSFRQTLVSVIATALNPSVESNAIHEAGQLIEKLHGGSLIIDDIQDNSEERRQQPTLHRQIGVAQAINVGNGLYFEALKRVFDWERDPDRQAALIRLCVFHLYEAHQGQALDLGVNIRKLPQSSVPAVCEASLRLKTGTLTALATGLGACVAKATSEKQTAAMEFGYHFGVVLQRCDDVGNTLPSAGKKQFEDLKLSRPSAIWREVAETVPSGDYQTFQQSSDAKEWESFLQRFEIGKKVRDRAAAELEVALQEWEKRVGDCPPLRDLAMTLMGAYGG